MEEIVINENVKVSKFDGNVPECIGITIFCLLLSIITLFIGLPWAICIKIEWETKHTIVDGRRLSFDGTGGQLLGWCILWAILTSITLGIYALWVPIKMSQWKAEHTHFESFQN